MKDGSSARQLCRRHFTLSVLGALTTGLLPDIAAAQPATRRLLVVGDSMSAEYGLQRGKGWVALLTERLKTSKPPVDVINASISGDTTAGGRARLPAQLKLHQPTHVIIELGGNDALRGLPLDATESNLLVMIKAAKAAGAKVLLVGMQVPPNYGPQYTRDFSALFGKAAKAEGAALVPFLLKGVADDADPLRWFQPDRIHPNESAQSRLLDNVWPVLKGWLPA